jgi:hypothetical protein
MSNRSAAPDVIGPCCPWSRPWQIRIIGPRNREPRKGLSSYRLDLLVLLLIKERRFGQLAAASVLLGQVNALRI